MTDPIDELTITVPVEIGLDQVPQATAEVQTVQPPRQRARHDRAW